MTWRVIQGDCVEAMRAMPEASVDAIVTDSPYGLGFMGKEWDSPGRAARATTTAIEKQPGNPFASSRTEYGGASYGTGFLDAMRGFHEWSIVWAREALRVLKPGGHLVAFGGTRTYHRVVCAIEDAGFEVRDSIHWVYGSGFPKSLSVSRAIDDALGAERGPLLDQEGNIVMRSRHGGGAPSEKIQQLDPDAKEWPATEAATAEAERWEGWGTALKPSHEPVVLARKPLIGTVAENVLAHGTGGLNIDACRICFASAADREDAAPAARATGKPLSRLSGTLDSREPFAPSDNTAGRWPPNLLLTHSASCRQVGTRKVKNGVAGAASRGFRTKYVGGERREVPAWECAPGCPVAALDAQSGELISGANPTRRGSDKSRGIYNDFQGQTECVANRGEDVGGASRFFPAFEWDATLDAPFLYVAKPARSERDAGLQFANCHPTVKPVALMEWLIRLVTPVGGTVLDPFVGSGTTGCAAVRLGADFIGIEREAEYVEIAEKRIAFAANSPRARPLKGAKAERKPVEKPEPAQRSLFGEGGW